MRPFEISLAFLIGAYFGWLLISSRRPNWVSWLPSAGLIVTLIHLIVEGYRWQMVPLYSLIILVLGIQLANWFRQRRPRSSYIQRGWEITGALSALVVFVIAVGLPTLLPVPHTPKPTGPFLTGTINRHLVDQSRAEFYSETEGEPREIIIQIWYPAGFEVKSPAAPWMNGIDIMGPAIAEWLELPHFFLDHIRYAHTHSLQDAPIANSGTPYPILIFSHGWGGFRSQNTYQAEELASHGYIVIAVQHTYGAVATIFPDGRVAYINPQALPRGLSENEYRLAANRLISQWAADIDFVLDHFTGLNQSDPEGHFTGHLDLAHIGVFGHSTGGGAAIEFCAQDPRCKALLGLDAYMSPVSDQTLTSGLSQPSLFLFSENWPSDANNRQFDTLAANLLMGRAFTILGTSHYDFTDLPMLTPLAPQLGLKGPLNGERALRIINDFSLAFFDKYLQGDNSPLAGGIIDDYPEVVTR